MKTAKTLLLFYLVISIFPKELCAGETQPNQNQLHQAYLAHWFSVTSKPIDLTVRELDADHIGDRAELNFVSDDGQTVNGTIAYPRNRNRPTKLALALHPMGSDQNFWWTPREKFPVSNIATQLREQGYTVISLDARCHGQRACEGIGPNELLKHAHSHKPRFYIDTIIGSVRDYRAALNWANSELQPQEVVLMGYSMGAQMSILLAGYEPSVSKLLVMVPPYVASPTSPVAPRMHTNRITNAQVLWLAGKDDPHSNQQQTRETFEKISSSNKTLTWFDSGHRLPNGFVEAAIPFLITTSPKGE